MLVPASMSRSRSTEHFGEFMLEVPSNLSSISRTKVSVLSLAEPVTMLSSTCVARYNAVVNVRCHKDVVAILVLSAP